MTDTYGPTSQQPSAWYDPDSSCWRTFQGSLLSPHPESLQTLPASGMTHDGLLYELPTSARVTDVPDGFVLPTPRATRGGSATETVNLLPTPTAMQPGGTAEQFLERKRQAGISPTLTDLAMVIQTLLPTPQASDVKGANNNENMQSLERYGPNLGMVVRQIGGSTNLPSDVTNAPLASQPQPLPTNDDG